MEIPIPPKQTTAAKSPYSKLNLPNLIRILRLEPAQDFSADLNGLFILHNLREGFGCRGTHVQYDALSYCWGKKEFPCKLFLEEDTSLNITAHLDTSLRYIRDTKEPKHIWIDAACINQKDDKEKSVQVPMMAQIYSKARKVHIWLGQEHQDISALAELFKNLAAVKTYFELPRRCCDDAREDLLYLETVSNLLKKAFGRHTTMPLKTFFALPWFTRRWILQEAALAMDCVVHVGSFSFPWEWLVGACKTLQASMKKDGFRLGCNECERTIVRICQISDTKVGILDLLWSYDASDCFDPRDRLFALYSLASDIKLENRQVDICACEWTLHQSRRIHYANHRYPIRVKVDYGCPWAEVYTQFARSAIESGHSSDILRHLSRFGSISSVNPKWPSWVPNWSNRRWRKMVADPIPDFRVPPLKIDHESICFGDILFGPVARVVSYAQEPDSFLSRLKSFAVDVSGLTRDWEQSVSSDPNSWGHTSANLAKDPIEMINDRRPPYSAVECTVRDIEFLLNMRCEDCISHMYTDDAENECPPVLDSVNDSNSPNVRRALRRCLHRLFPDVLPPDPYMSYQCESNDSEAMALDKFEEQAILRDMLQNWCLFYTEGTETDCPYLGIGPASMSEGDYLWPPGGMTDYLVLREQAERICRKGLSPTVLRYIGCCFLKHTVNIKLGFKRRCGPPGFVKEFMLV